MNVEFLIMHYGYAALFVGALLEGETFLILAGFAASRGYLTLHAVILVAFAGSFLADQAWFHLGRVKGTAFVERRRKWAARSDQIRELVHRKQNLLMLGFRFVPGTRTLTPIVMGAMGFDARRFALLNAVGAMVWAVAIGWVGFLFGTAAEHVFAHLQQYERWLLAAIAAAGATLWIVRRIRLAAEARRPDRSWVSEEAAAADDSRQMEHK